MTDRFVKLSVGYYRDPKVAGLDDAAEVMFTRALSYCGDARTAGMVPDAILGSLTRRPGTSRKVAERIAATGAWARVDGGYQILRWADWQDALDVIEERRRRDRERKANARAVRGQSADTSADFHEQSKRKSKKELPQPHARERDEIRPELEILRSRLAAARLVVRWDKLTDDQSDEIVALVQRHGDRSLVKAALAAYRPGDPPKFATAWLGAWRNLPDPGKRLQLVTDPPCDLHHQPHPCTGCAADRKGNRP